jgi:hypothetical protein
MRIRGFIGDWYGHWPMVWPICKTLVFANGSEQINSESEKWPLFKRPKCFGKLESNQELLSFQNSSYCLNL